MATVISGRCVGCRYTSCVEVCPTDSFFRLEAPAMLVINPDTCIDCGGCGPACPVQAIYRDDDVPAPYRAYVAFNAESWSQGEQLVHTIDPLPSAVDLDTIHAREEARGWRVGDP